MKIRVVGSDIKIVDRELIVTESINAYVIEFQFDKAWNEMTNKTAVFYQPSVNRDNPSLVIIDENNRVTIPSSALVTDDFLYIGVFGFSLDGKTRIPTIFTYTYVERGCYKSDNIPLPDSTVYEQIYNMALKAWTASQESSKEPSDNSEYIKRDELDGLVRSIVNEVLNEKGGTSNETVNDS